MYSIVTFPGDGVTTNHPVPFPYISEDHLHTYLVNSSGTAVEVAHTHISAGVLAVTPAPPVGQSLKITRETPLDEPLVDFGVGVLAPDDLDVATAQVLYGVQEGLDNNLDAEALVRFLLASKAELHHTHDAYGNTIFTIGTSSSHPAIVLGLVQSDTDTKRLVMLNADGSVRASSLMDFDYATQGEALAGTLTNKIINPATLKAARDADAVTFATAAALAVDMRPLVIPAVIADEQAGAENNTTYGGLTFVNAGAWAWTDFKAWLSGVNWRVVIEGMMTTGSASAVGLNIAYLVAGSGAIAGMVKTRRKNSTAYALNDLRLPPTPNGHYYKCTTAGTSAASPPTFNTGAGSTTTDGTAVWTEQGASFKNLALNVTAPATAYARFDVDSATLQIPTADVALGNRVFFALWRDPGDAHAGDLIVTRLAIQPVGV